MVLGRNGFYRNGLLGRGKYGAVEITKADNIHAARNIAATLRSRGAKVKIVAQPSYLVQSRMPLKKERRR